MRKLYVITKIKIGRKYKMKKISLLMLGALFATVLFATEPVQETEPFVVACVGDSITAGGYPRDLQNILGEGWKVLNFGVNSRTAQVDGKEGNGKGELGYVKTLVYENSLKSKANAVILLIGTNDSKTVNCVGREEIFKRDYAALVDKYIAMESHPIVIVALSPFVKSSAWTISEERIRTVINPAQKAVAEERGLAIVDLHTLFEENAATILSGDGVHPNAAGRTLLAETFAAKLKELCAAK